MVREEEFAKSFCPDWCPKKHTECNYECEDPKFREEARLKGAKFAHRPIRKHSAFYGKFQI